MSVVHVGTEERLIWRERAFEPYEAVEEAPLVAELDDTRGEFATWLFIASEAMLFVLLFFAYYYTARGGARWLVEEPPSLRFALPMLGILLLSSAVLFYGEQQVKKMRHSRAMHALGVTILLGCVFLGLSYFDYRSHLQHLWPTSNAYGSIHYTITSVHLAHLTLGLFMLVFVLALPRVEPADRPPHKPYRCAALYWHFVDTVWVFIVTLLYVVPHFRT